MRYILHWSVSYLKHHALRSLIIAFSLAMLIYLPFGLQRLIKLSGDKLMQRAVSTDLILTAQSGGTDELIESLYFKRGDGTSWLNMADVDSINSHRLGYALPMLTGLEAQGFSIAGTQVDYFKFRNLKLQAGNYFRMMGECVIGSNVAEHLNITVGDSLISTPSGFFDLAGIYPLKMTVAGVLAPTETPDDQAVFTDIKTTWVIMGLGHGHENVEDINDPTLILSKSDSLTRTTAKLLMYQEITPDNIEEYHFHGTQKDLPVRSIIYLPKDNKALAMFRGRIEIGESTFKSLIPSEVVSGLLQNVFRLREVFAVIYTWVLVASLLILAIIFSLIIKLRATQIETLRTLGASRNTVFKILATELLLLTCTSMLIAAILLHFTGNFTDAFIDRVVF